MGDIGGIVTLVIGIVGVLFMPDLVRATVTAGMGEVLRWAGDFFRVVVTLMAMLAPSIVFWLVVIGIIAIIQQWIHTGLYQTVQGKIQKSLETVTRKMAVKSCSIQL